MCANEVVHAPGERPMRRKLLVALFSALALSATNSTAHAATFDCGRPPPLANEAWKAELNGRAQTIGKIGSAGLGGAIASSRSEVISKYPNADRVIADAYFNYMVCSIVMNDTKLTSDEKLARIVSARKAFSTPIPKQAPKTTAKPKAPIADMPVAAVVPPPNTFINQSVNGNVGVFNQGTIPLARRQYVPQLQKFYTQGSDILDRSRSKDLTDAQVSGLVNEFNAWFQQTHDWIIGNMTPAAAKKFTRWSPSPMSYSMAGDHPQEVQHNFQALNILTPQYLENLLYLMNNDALDPQQ